MERKRAPGGGRKPKFGKPMGKIVSRLPTEQIDNIDEAVEMAKTMVDDGDVTRSRIIRAVVAQYPTPDDLLDVLMASVIGGEA